MLDRYTHLQPVESEVEIRRMQTLIADVVEDPGNFKSEWLKERRWTVVPVESADHFSDTDVTLLSAAFRKADLGECLAVAAEPLDNTPLCYKVPATEEGLREFNQAVWAFHFILIPEDRSCAVLCTKDDYYLVGGPTAFVTLAVGTEIVEARAKFAAFAVKHSHATMREALCDLSSRCEGIEPEGKVRVRSLQPFARP